MEDFGSLTQSEILVQLEQRGKAINEKGEKRKTRAALIFVGVCSIVLSVAALVFAIFYL